MSKKLFTVRKNPEYSYSSNKASAVKIPKKAIYSIYFQGVAVIHIEDFIPEKKQLAKELCKFLNSSQYEQPLQIT